MEKERERERERKRRTRRTKRWRRPVVVEGWCWVGVQGEGARARGEYR